MQIKFCQRSGVSAATVQWAFSSSTRPVAGLRPGVHGSPLRGSTSQRSFHRCPKLPRVDHRSKHLASALPGFQAFFKLNLSQTADTCPGVRLSSAVTQSLHAANDTLDVLPQQPSYITDAPRLFMACLSHPDCTELCTRLESNGVIIEEVRAVLQAAVGRQMRDLEDMEVQSAPCYSSLTKRIIQCAMQHAVRQGRDIVELKDLLYTLTSNRDVISITSNPLYFAINRMYKPFQVDKVMDTWCDLLATMALPLPGHTSGLLPPYILPSTCDLLLPAIEASNKPVSLTSMLQTYSRLCWVPSVSISVMVWDRLLVWKGWDSLEGGAAEELLSVLATLPLPPQLKDKSYIIVTILYDIFMRTPRAEHVVGYKEEPTHGLFLLLQCLARLEEAFPRARDQEHRAAQSDIVVYGLHSISYKVIRKLVGSLITSKPAEAYVAMKSLAYLDSVASLDSMLPYHLSQFTRCLPDIAAACISQTMMLHYRLDLKQLQTTTLFPSIPANHSIKCILPPRTWIHLLSVTAHFELEHGKDLVEHLHRQWGYTWEGADKTVQANRFAILASMSDKEKRNMVSFGPLAHQWLWDEVVKIILEAGDLVAAQPIVQNAKQALDAPAPQTADRLSKALQRILVSSEPNDSIIPAFFALTAQHAEWAAASVAHGSNGPSTETIPIVKSTGYFEDKGMTVACSSMDDSVKSLQEVHELLAHAGVSKSLPYIPPDTHQERLAILKELAEQCVPHDLAEKLQHAASRSQVTVLEAITWICMDGEESVQSAEKYDSDVYLLRSAAMLSVMKDQSNPISRQLSSSAILQRWLPLVQQRILSGLHSNAMIAIGPNMTEREMDIYVPFLIIYITALKQAKMPLPENTYKLFADKLDKATKSTSSAWGDSWISTVWAISMCWSKDQPPLTTHLSDEHLLKLENLLTGPTMGWFLKVQDVLMTAAAACQFSEHLSGQNSDVPFVMRQLLLATSKALLHQINAFTEHNGSSMHNVELRDWNDKDLLLLCCLTQRLASRPLPAAISKEQVSSALQILTAEVERRMDGNAEH